MKIQLQLAFSCALIFLAVTSGFGGIAATDSIGKKTVDGKEFVVYLVSGGETVYGISTKYQVPIEEMMQHNPKLIDGLKTGMILNIPYKKELIEEHSSDRKTHVVKPGETLYGISRKHNIPLNKLLKWNGMELKAGQTIYISPSDPTPTSDDQVVADEMSIEEENSVAIKDNGDLENTTSTNKTEKKDPVIKNPNKNNAQNVSKTNVNTASTNPYWTDEVKPAPELGPKTKPRVMIIPFDPYLYFSDADAEIAQASNMSQTKVRQVFRRRLNAMLQPKGYETIHLLGGILKDSLGDLNKIYKSVTYNYQEILDNGTEQKENFVPETKKKKKKLGFKFVDNLASSHSKSPTGAARSHKDNRYFGVQIKDPRFYDYFGTKYGIDYYVFINQFEVRTDYQTCLDRSSNKYERNFLTHYSIFDSKGEQLAGNKITTYYHSNSNNVKKIVLDNMPEVTERIMSEVPSPLSVKNTP